MSSVQSSTIITNTSAATSNTSVLDGANSVVASTRQTTKVTGNGVVSNTSNAASGGTALSPQAAAMETSMKQQVSQLVGDGKGGQYATHPEMVAAINAKLGTLKGQAKAGFLAKLEKILEPAGANGGVKGADGKPLNQGKAVGAEGSAIKAKWESEMVGKTTAPSTQPKTTATPTGTGTVTPSAAASVANSSRATTTDTTDGSRQDRRGQLATGVNAMDTSKDGRISSEEVCAFANKVGGVSNDKVYNGLREQAAAFEQNGQTMSKAFVLEYLDGEARRDTTFSDKVRASSGT